MSISLFTPAAAAQSEPSRRLPAIAAAVATLLFIVVEAAQGLPGLANVRGDNDSLMRLAEVRDLLNGQGWFDLTQYRLGLDGGTIMHWSRLIDAPLAAIIGLGTYLTGSAATGEAAGLLIWPLLAFAMAIFFLVRTAERLGGESAVLPACVIGAVSLYAIGIFRVGAIDHHNVQFALTVAALSLVVDARQTPRYAWFAGMAAALSIAIGMETAPYVATLCIAVAAWFLIQGNESRRPVMNFGLGFAGTALVAHLTTIAPSAWLTATCDAFSIAQLSTAVIGGFGLALATALPSLQQTVGRRAAALLLIGLIALATLAVFFPQCLAAPYSDLDPRQKLYWLDSVVEAQPFWNVVRNDWVIAAGYYGTPTLAVGLTLASVIRKGWRFESLIVGTMVLAALLVGVWQVRGALFAVGLATIPLAAWVAKWRHVSPEHQYRDSMRMMFAWALSLCPVWSATASGIDALAGNNRTTTETIAAEHGLSLCGDKADFRILANLPSATVLSDINLGSKILAFTHHRAVAAPYHRNAGNVVAYEVQSGSGDGGHELLVQNGITLFAICRNVDESADLTEGKPDSLHARLFRDAPPAWLQIVPESKAQAIQIYRVVASPN